MPFLLFSQNNNLNWVNTISSQGQNTAYSFSYDSQGFVYSVGSFESTTEFDNRTSSSLIETSSGASDIFLTKYSPSGSLA